LKWIPFNRSFVDETLLVVTVGSGWRTNAFQSLTRFGGFGERISIAVGLKGRGKLD
jgi:hypothetical protein